MNLDGRSRLRLGTASNRLSRWLAVLFPVTMAGSVLGQSVLAPPPGFQGAPAVPATGNVTPTTGQSGSQMSGQTIQQINDAANGTSSSGQGKPSSADANAPKEVTGEAATAPLDALANWGATHVHLRAGYQFLYSDGLHNQPGEATHTITHSLSPGISVQFGPHITGDYSANIRFYSQKDFHNTVDHAFGLNGGFNYGENWTFGASQAFSITDQPMVETSSQTKQTDYSAGLFGSYRPNEHVTLTTTVNVGLHYTDNNKNSTNIFVGSTPTGLSDSQNYSGAEALDYKFNEHLTGGASVSVGYTDQNEGFKSVDQQYNLHLGWHPGTKLTVSASGGVEHQNFLNVKAEDSWNPVYSADIGYQLFEQTSLSAFAHHSASASIFNAQLSETTGLGIGLQQRILGVLHLTLGFGYTKADYKATSTAHLNTSRTDEGTSFTAGLSVPFLKHCGFSTFYQYTQNSSSQEGFSYDSNQVGASLSWSY